MNRRGFIKAIASAAVGAAIAPVLPVADRTAELNGFVEALNDGVMDEINQITLKQVWASTIRDNFFKATPIYCYFRDHGKIDLIEY